MHLVAAGGLESALAFLKRWEHVEIEIGSGNGHFLAEYGFRNPAVGLIGVELKLKRCEKIKKKIETLGLKNVFVGQGDVLLLLDRLSSSSIDAFHVYFPDPWPKTKHRKRRFLKKQILDRFFEVLKEDGKIHFASDVFDYYLQLKMLALVDGRFTTGTARIPEETVHSLYARKTFACGQKSYCLTLVKIKA